MTAIFVEEVFHKVDDSNDLSDQILPSSIFIEIKCNQSLLVNQKLHTFKGSIGYRYFFPSILTSSIQLIY